MVSSVACARDEGFDRLGLDRQHDVGALTRRRRRHHSCDCDSRGQHRRGSGNERDGRGGESDGSSVHRYAGQCNVPSGSDRWAEAPASVTDQRFETVIWMILRNFTGRPLSIAG